MKKNVLLWGIVSILVFASIVLVVFNTRYLYNNSGDSISLMQYDQNLSASVILSFSFITMGYVFILVSMSKQKTSMTEFFLRASLVLSLYPIIRGVIFLLLDVSKTKDMFYYFTLGSTFIVHHPELYSTSLTFDEIVNIGENLQFGVASYLLIVLFILMLINQIVFAYIYYRSVNRYFTRSQEQMK